MIRWIRRLFVPPLFEGDEDKTRVARLLNILLLSILAILVPVTIIAPITLPQPLLGLIIPGSMTLLTCVALWSMHRGRVQLASVILLSMEWLVYLGLMIVTGGKGSAFAIGLLSAAVMAGLLLGGRAALVTGGLSIAAGLGIFYLGDAGLLPAPLLVLEPGVEWLVWVSNVVSTIVPLYLGVRDLDEALERARRLTTELEGQRETLEVTVEERTSDLARRTRYLEAASAIARDAAAVLDVNQLLARVVALVSERFGFYHAGIFILDPAREWAVLQTASSEGGQRMVARGHRLKVGQTGIVGETAARGRPHLALDVGADAVFFDNPDLPGTRSEVALPLRAREETIGVLDVQSTESATFGQEDVAVLQTLADQVAVAISNAQLYQQVQASLDAERRAYGELSAKAWQEMARRRPGLGRRYDPEGMLPAEDAPAGGSSAGELPEAMRRAVAEARPVAAAGGNLAVPVKIRGQVIGVLDAHKPAGALGWTDGEQALLVTLADQLGVALDSARLYQETERRAAQERLVGEVTARMRQTLDVDAVLQTAVRDIGESLGLHDLAIRLTIPPEDGGTFPPEDGGTFPPEDGGTFPPEDGGTFPPEDGGTLGSEQSD